ncbi:TetR/AcrR family transcriptional regulator [Rhodococcus gannanensis]|uniref:TetR/AcrR family transcriptional regulator n=1 Tax=Rhodococcus gannanensis TaxID=1960308 RepID=A0ABW4P7X6_9NOCA
MSDEVLTAARSLVQRNGLTALNLTAVAREAGISRATVYRRFSSKEQLVDALVHAELRDLETLVRSRVKFADEPRETTRMLVRAVLDHLTDNAPLQAALRIDGSTLTPWLVRGGDQPTLVDVVTERTLVFVKESPLAPHLSPDPASAVEFLVSVVFAELLSPARYVSHAQVASYVAEALHPRATA